MLNQEQVEKLRQMVACGGWREVLVPALEHQIKQSQETALLPPSKRPERFKGLTESEVVSELRGGAEAFEFVLKAFVNEIRVFDHNRLQDELAKRESNGTGANPAQLPIG